MNTVVTVKQRLIDYLAQMDLNKLTMIDLREYTGIIYQLTTMDKPDYMEAMAKAVGLAVQKPSAPTLLEEVS